MREMLDQKILSFRKEKEQTPVKEARQSSSEKKKALSKNIQIDVSLDEYSKIKTTESVFEASLNEPAMKKASKNRRKLSQKKSGKKKALGVTNPSDSLIQLDLLRNSSEESHLRINRQDSNSKKPKFNKA